MLSSSSSGSSSSRAHLQLVRRPTPPGDGPAELDRDWLEACRARVQSRMAACSGPLDGLHGPVGLDDDDAERRPEGWPDRLASAWSALRAWRQGDAGETLPTVRDDRLRLPARVTLPQRRR